MKRLGPELKMPKFKGGEAKVPPFIADLYIDLRDRRLLPIVVLLIVGIVAAPILLNDGSTEPETAPAPVMGGSSTIEQASHRSLTVVRAEPGLRNYRKRLAHRKPTDPFEQRYTGPMLAGAELNEPTSTTSTSEASEPSSTETVESGSSPSGGAGTEGTEGGNGGRASQLTILTFAANIQYAHTEEKADGSVEMGKPTLREKVRPYTPLPGVKAPVVTYLGIGQGGETALLMVSKEVTAVFGDGKCISGTDSCELLEVETGIPTTFEYGPNHVRYKINVLKIVPLVAGHT
jgi:hypothetical protein